MWRVVEGVGVGGVAELPDDGGDLVVGGVGGGDEGDGVVGGVEELEGGWGDGGARGVGGAFAVAVVSVGAGEVGAGRARICSRAE